MSSNHSIHFQTISAIKCMSQVNVFIIFWFHDIGLCATLCEAICESLSSPALSGPRPFPFPLRLAFIETAPCWHPIFLVDKSVALETHPLYRFGGLN